MLPLLFRGVIAGVIVVGVSEISKRSPRLGALLLTLPIVSIVAILATWQRDHDLTQLVQLSRETLILVPLGLPFFIPLAFAHQWGLAFWSAFGLGLLMASVTIGLWLWFGPTAST